jgi:glycosyltransferase involved in cell wall biosynthesis
MTDQPLVSVVIATRNRPEMLREAIDAVVGQTYAGPIETLVVFDQVDPDPSIASEVVGRRVAVLSNAERTPGLAGARNTGILAATGEFVAFCDDDDYWLPEKLERQIAQIGSALTSVTGIIVEFGGTRTERVPDASDFTLKNLVRTRVMEAHPSTVLMRRDAILGPIGLVDEELPKSYAEDWDFIIRAIQAGSVSVVEEPLIVVRWGQSMFSRDWETIILAMDYMMSKHAAIRGDRRAVAHIYGRRGFANAALGRRGAAFHDAWRAAINWPLEKRVFVTVPVASGIISAPRVMEIAHRRGRGI